MLTINKNCWICQHNFGMYSVVVKVSFHFCGQPVFNTNSQSTDKENDMKQDQISPELQNWISTKFLDVIPVAVAAIDRDSNIVFANNSFEERFGDWQGRKCYEVYQDKKLAETYCKIPEVFKDGLPRTYSDVGYDVEGRLTHYTKHAVPVLDSDGKVIYLIEILTDITETVQMRREYQLLFDQVPCSVLIIDRNYQILRTNQTLQKMLGELEGGYCYNALKGLDHKCVECTARQTFETGQMNTGHHVWKMKDGKTVHLHVITVPVLLENGKFDSVMELAVDITDTMKLQDSLGFAHSFVEAIISTAMDGIFGVNEKGKVTVFNDAARMLFKVAPDQVVAPEELAAMLPKGFLARVSESPQHVYLPQTRVRTIDGDEIPVRLVGTPLSIGDKSLGMAFSVQDQSEIKTLERQKLEAERLATVGQTVAGLAHGIKNLVIALEGGMYMIGTGLQKGDIERLQKGTEQLNRNISRISTVVKTFLRFARGREIRTRMVRPTDLAIEVIDMYTSKAEENGIELTMKLDGEIRPAPLDYDALLECLSNLVDNAIDACILMDDGQKHHVELKAIEEEGSIIYEVTDDGGGMEDEVQEKIFHTIYTTKGLSGNGLGLMTTNKMVQEHGGTMFMHSIPGKGTTFRIVLPRMRLPRVHTD